MEAEPFSGSIDEARYGFEALYRSLVEHEKAGFEQCRKAVIDQVTKMRDAARRAYDGEGHDEGQLAAYENVLGFLRKDS